MSVLYRRFTLVASLIAALGVLTSILIQETRRDDTAYRALLPVQGKILRLSCEGEKTCRSNVSIHLATV